MVRAGRSRSPARHVVNRLGRVTNEDFTTFPIDAVSQERLAAQGLRLGLVDTSDAAAFDAWLRADLRGFHQGDPSEKVLKEQREGLAYRRTTGVWDETVDEPVVPVATVNSWPANLTVPGGRTVPAWAISSVTVAPTHRRRGVARAMLESELRTAAALGLPLAMLTVSESSIYGRYGFAPAALAADLVIDTKRARWTGPVPGGNVHFIPNERFVDEVAGVHERYRLSSPGELPVWPLRWQQLAGLTGDDEARKRGLRTLRYADEQGETRGVAIFKIDGGDADFTKHTLHLEHLLAETDDAYAALWRFVLEMDLVSEVRAGLRSVDEPLLWQIADFRGVKAEVQEHQYLRVLDVPVTLESRSYFSDGAITLGVTDDLGFATGVWRVEVANGAATVTETTDAPELTLTVNQLSSVLLGGVRPSTLLRASGSPVPDGMDALFASDRTPWLSVWY